jgi:uncharacterized membrane protein
MISFNAIHNVESIPIKFLKSLNIPIETDLILAELEKHPDYPSLLSISDVLSNFSVKNEAFRIEPDELDSIPCPFAAQTDINQNDFVIVKKVTNESVWLSNEKWNNHKMDLKEFKDHFSGVILVAEPDHNKTFSLKQVFKTHLLGRSALILGLLIILVTGLFNSGFFAHLTWQLVVMAGLKTTGVIVGCLLLVQSLDSNNPLIRRFCRGDDQSSCNAILSSKAAKVFSWLSWSEVGFFYFGGTWLLIIFNSNMPATWSILAFLNLVSLPYTVYSIYYQARIAKQWCVLCCTVQTLLWLEFFVMVFNFDFNQLNLGIITWTMISRSVICLISPVIFWFMVKPMILGLKLLQPLKKTLRNFKYNTEIFQKLLTGQTKFVTPDKAWSITIGSDNPTYTITMVSNLYCQPCARTHKVIEELLSMRDDISVRIIFNTLNDQTDPRFKATWHMLALNALEDKSLIHAALHSWYRMENKKYETWATLNPLPQLDSTALSSVLQKQREWCDMVDLTGTPSLYINGYYLPDIYQLEDLKYLLDYN